jgi:AraC family transcriptional regulator
MNKSLVLNFANEGSRLQILPSKPIMSSRKVSWNNIQIEFYLHPAHEAPEHSSEQHFIVIFHKPIKLIKRLIGTKVKDERIEVGDIVVVPAKVPHSACWYEETSFTLISIEPKFLTRIAYEFLDLDCVEILPHFAKPDPVIYEIVSQLRSQLEFEQESNQMYVDLVATFLATHLLKHYSIRKESIKKDTSSLSQKDLRQVIDYINAHLDRNLSLTELADLVEISHYHFARLFKKSTGVSPGRYIIDRRLDRVASLLAEDLTIDEIAQCTGFSSHSYLCRMFRKYRSVTPDRYRQML